MEGRPSASILVCLLADVVVLMLNFSKKKPATPETLLKKKKQRAELLQRRAKTAALFKQVERESCKLTAFKCIVGSVGLEHAGTVARRRSRWQCFEASSQTFHGGLIPAIVPQRSSPSIHFEIQMSAV